MLRCFVYTVLLAVQTQASPRDQADMMAIEGEKLGKHCTKNIITEEPMQCQVTIEGLERAQRYIVIISIYIYDKLLPVSTTAQMETS